MASDRPLFDDEELPAWMRNAGITPGSGGDGEPGQPAQQAPQTPASGTPADDLSWLDEQPAAQDIPWMQDVTPGAPASAAPASNDLPPWMADVVPGGTATAPSAQYTPPWMQDVAPS